jgi:hypothetical protein
MNKFIKILFGIYFLFIFFLIGKNCFASVDLDYFTGSYDNYYITIGESPTQRFYPNQPTITSAQFLLYDAVSIANCNSNYNAANCSDLLFTLCKGHKTTAIGGLNCEGNTLITTTSQKPICGINTVNFSTSTPININQGQEYYISIQGTSGACVSSAIYLNTVITIPTSNGNNGVYGYDYNPMQFKTLYDGDYYSINYVPYVDNTGGLSNGGIYKDFDFWQMEVFKQATTSNITIQINYGNSTTTGYTSDNENISAYPNQSIFNLTVSKYTSLENGKYWTWAELIDDKGNFLAESPYLYFWIDNVNGSSTFSFTAPPEYQDNVFNHICDDIATSSGTLLDDLRYNTECGFKKFVYWAFTPTKAAQDGLIISYTNIKKLFPFNVYFNLTNTVTNSISTSTATTGTFDIPFINKTGDFYMLPVLSSSSLPNLIGGTNANLFRNSISWIIWILVAFLIFIIFKKI